MLLRRNLKASLLDTERYKEELRELIAETTTLTAKIQGIRDEIKMTKEELNKCRMESFMPKGKIVGPKFNKDTKVSYTTLNLWYF
jgi:chromosome segregation ATPase